MNDTNTKKISLPEIIYLLYFVVMFGARAAGLYEGMLAYNISLVIGMLLFAAKVATTEHSIFEYIVMALLLGMSLLVYKNTGEKGLLLYMTMILGMKGVSLKRVEKTGVTILGVCFPVLVFLSTMGIITDISYPADGRLLPGQMLRRSLGYPYFNTMFTTYVVLVVLIMLVCGYLDKKTLFILSLFLFAVGIYLYIYSCSNTGMIVLTLFLAANFLLQIKENIKQVEGLIIRLLYPVCCVISAILPLVLNDSAFAVFDKIFHNRFNYARYYLTSEPVTLFGTRFAPTPNDNYIIDSSFLYSFLQIGVVPCILLTAMMMVMIHTLVKENRRIEIAVVISFCVLGLSDPFFYNLSYKNIMMLFVGSMFYVRIGKAESLLPAVFGRKMCLCRLTDKDIEYGESLLYKKWNFAGEFFVDIFREKGLQNLVVMAVVLMILSGIAYFGMDRTVVTGIVDTIPEWEYFRKAMSIGMWGGIFTAMVSAAFRKVNGKNTN